MTDSETFKSMLSGYKEYFPNHWNDEKFKWEAVQYFQEHWNIDAPNFGEMFKEATDKTYSLLASGYAYPREMIIRFATADNEATRQMFRDLFDETMDLSSRVEKFQVDAEEMRAKYDDGTWKKHYQNTNAISTYLWLRYPDKYYIYKYETMSKVAPGLDTEYQPRHDGSVESMLGGYAMYDDICSKLQKDSEIQELVAKHVDENCWPDKQLRTTTIDFGFYLTRFYLPEKENEREEQEVQEWFPTDYTPRLTVDNWVELLEDKSVFTPNALQIVKRMKDYGGQATCKQLSIKYGENPNFYNSGSTALAHRVAEATGCPVLQTDTESSRWWPILYTGKKADNNTEGVYIWRLRSELSKALEQVDLNDVPLYVDATPAIWKISHGDISEDQRIVFRERSVVVVHGSTRAKGVSKISQGQEFIDGIKKDDFFYLCYGNSIQLLGQFTSGKAEPNPEKQDGWYERSYRVIAESKDTSAYSSTQKWWTPNDNSTCIRVSDEEKPLFEELILQPYFGMTIAELYGEANEKNKKYDKSDFLNDVFLSEKQYDKMVAVLRRKKNIILQGAPGVGKTYAAKKLAYSMMGEEDEDRIKFVQFHQNYSYEDFVIGYKPTEDGGFQLKEGIFYQFCKKAENHQGKDFFLLIDEINRGNMSKIFGELLMLIENDYRGKEKVNLAYNDKSFSVPENLYIIGMMNTADRSLAMIDYALRRRFSFFGMEPAFDSEGFKKYQTQLENETFDRLIDSIKELNQEIIKDPSLGKGFCIGHSYFSNWKKRDCTEEKMLDTVDFEIIPMLEEYWFDNDKELQRWEDILHGVFQ